MELDELKSAWNKISSSNEKKHQLRADEFQKILSKRTLDITEKVGRNIRIGTGIILAWVCLGFATDFILTPVIEKQLDKPYLTDKLMFWAFFLEAFNYLLIFSAIIIFWIRYSKIERSHTETTDLRSKLIQIIDVLDSYRRMFYIVMVIVLLYVAVSFSSGFIMEYQYQISEMGIDIQNFKFLSWAIIVITFVVCLGIFIAIYYLLFNLFFKRLYGRYLKQLKETLKEINEASELTE